VRGALGNEVVLNSFTVVVSFPESELQHIHRDNALLFGEHPAGTTVPAHALNVSVALIDVDEKIGPTAVIPGSHRWSNSRAGTREDLVPVPLERGDALVIDLRLQHAGMPNGADRPRPILYLVYARSWFWDAVNHDRRDPLRMELETFMELPPEVQRVMVRAIRRQLLDGPVASKAPAPEAPEEERTCPCGSGEPYSTCHGKKG
jgi:ectoine hydroxylase-related dioxygenase (phytanoyl-CoA dioxygenase family)